jgi:Arc/MetJ-type ribon-helix-helix transcriptional regulator
MECLESAQATAHPTMTRAQLNVRVSDTLEQAIDKKRIELSAKLGTIPSRSDVVRFALEGYLGVDLSETEVDGRRAAPAKARRR